MDSFARSPGLGGVLNRPRSPLAPSLLAVFLLALWAAPVRAAGDAPAQAEFFEKNVRPVLVEHCYKCHSAQAKRIKGGLLLDSRAGLLKGGDSGPAIVPGRPEQSRLVEALGYKNPDLQMPPRGRLSDRAVTDLTAWVKNGAYWPATATSGGTVSRSSFDLQARKREHWAWQPVRAVPPPAVRDTAWPRDPIDRFILARLEAHALHPAAPADRATLLRRVSFDLVGLPPTPEEVTDFVSDRSPDAFEKVVDRLLASPHFGERWGRHWLDLVRYAESRGHEFDYPLPNAYQYRDYVLRALNADVPYDQLVIEHLAGDLLQRPRLDPTEHFNESILGTGFWFLGEELHSPVDVRQDEADRFDNRIDVMTKAFLGLTVACARCHDHKFDAISTRDYYALFGLLESCSYRLARFDTMEQNRHVAAELWRLRERRRPAVQRTLAANLRPAVERLADYLLAAREVLRGQRARLEAVAQNRRLDATLLKHWVNHLQNVKDDRDPFFAWARAACDPAAKEIGGREVLRSIARSWRERLVAGENEVVVDYARPGPGEWLPDSPAFGPSPTRPGDVRLGIDPEHPTIRICERAAAEIDPAWDRLTPADGIATDPGALAGPARAGHTLRTPTFTLTGGKVYYLVRGAGRAYAAVDQHLMIAGPLHARLVLPIHAEDRFQWVEHDLTPYRGQHVHVEFTADPGASFAVAQVVQAATVPGLADPPSAALLRLIDENAAGHLEGLAEGYQRVFTEAVESCLRFAPACKCPLDDSPARSQRARNEDGAQADLARLVNWLVRHPDMLPGGGERLLTAMRPFVAEEAPILARIQMPSRLALAMWDGTGVDECVFLRGSPKALGERVPRRFLEALAGPDSLAAGTGSGRLQLARQMIDPKRDPFISRVPVNRVWHHLFGRGLVASVDNFGVLGEPPTHPELLDYLADRFVRDGWSIKRLIRALVLSSTYRMAARSDAEADRADPEDLLLHRMRLRRLEGEALRDALLAVSGRLNPAMYGPPVPVHLTEFQQGRGRPESGPLDGDGRRSVYLAVRRNFLSPLLLAFDTPIPFSTVGRRTVSNVPAQALILLNDPFVHQQAEVWARRVLRQEGTPAERVTRMYQTALGRPPSETELRDCLDFLDEQSRLARSPMFAWTDLAHVLFNAKEFLFLD